MMDKHQLFEQAEAAAKAEEKELQDGADFRLQEARESYPGIVKHRLGIDISPEDIQYVPGNNLPMVVIDERTCFSTGEARDLVLWCKCDQCGDYQRIGTFDNLAGLYSRLQTTVKEDHPEVSWLCVQCTANVRKTYHPILGAIAYAESDVGMGNYNRAICYALYSIFRELERIADK